MIIAHKPPAGIAAGDEETNMFKVGDKVVVKDNAFEGSDDPKDFEYRGKEGVIALDLDLGEYQVDFPDGDFAYLKDTELKQAA
jgi:hypothetical protein